MDPEEVDHAPHLVVGLVLHVGEAKKFPPELGFERLDPFLRVSKARSMFDSHRAGWR